MTLSPTGSSPICRSRERISTGKKIRLETKQARMVTAESSPPVCTGTNADRAKMEKPKTSVRLAKITGLPVCWRLSLIASCLSARIPQH
jgi:hypothetical protein